MPDPPAQDAGDPPGPQPTAMLSRAMRRSGRRGARVLAVLSLLVALGAIAVVVRTAGSLSAPEPLEAAAATGWEATGALSDTLRALVPGSPRGAARKRAGRSADVVAGALRRVEALELATSQTPRRTRVVRALRADAAWIGAVGSTLANPRSRRRSELPRLARRAALATSVVAADVPAARGTVGGTGRLLAATSPR